MVTTVTREISARSVRVEIENEIPASSLMVYTALTLLFVEIVTVARSHTQESPLVTALLVNTIVRVMVSVLGPGRFSINTGVYGISSIIHKRYHLNYSNSAAIANRGEDSVSYTGIPTIVHMGSRSSSGLLNNLNKH